MITIKTPQQLQNPFTDTDTWNKSYCDKSPVEAPGILPNGFQKILNPLIKQFLLNVCFMSDTMAVVIYEGTKQRKSALMEQKSWRNKKN